MPIYLFPRFLCEQTAVNEHSGIDIKENHAWHNAFNRPTASLFRSNHDVTFTEVSGRSLATILHHPLRHKIRDVFGGHIQ